MLRSLDWCNVTCEPAFDRGQFLTSVVKMERVPCVAARASEPLPKSLETQVKCNNIKWYVRRVSIWSVCDEVIQECLNNVLEAVDSEDIPCALRAKWPSEVRMRCGSASLNPVP